MAKKLKIEETEYELPEGVDDLNTLLAKFSELTGQLPTLKQQADQFAQFQQTWGDPTTLQQRLQEHVQGEVAKAVAAAKAEGATRQEAKAVGDDVWAQWAELTPQQQAQAMLTQLNTGMEQRLNALVQDKWNQAQQTLTATNANTQQQFDLLARALDAKLANPKLDLTQVWSKMTDLAKATPEKLMELAMQAVRAPGETEALIAKEREKWEEERGKIDAADRMKVLNSDSLASWRKPKEVTPSLTRDGEDSLRQHILSKALAGEGAFKDNPLRPEQI